MPKQQLMTYQEKIKLKLKAAVMHEISNHNLGFSVKLRVFLDSKRNWSSHIDFEFALGECFSSNYNFKKNRYVPSVIGAKCATSSVCLWLDYYGVRLRNNSKLILLFGGEVSKDAKWRIKISSFMFFFLIHCIALENLIICNNSYLRN